MTSYNVYVAPPDNPPLSEISDLPAYLETKEFTGSTPPPTISASMTLSGRLVGLSLPDAVFEAEEEISEKDRATGRNASDGTAQRDRSPPYEGGRPVTQVSSAAAMGAWASRTRTELEQLRSERAQAFTGVQYETENGMVTVDIGPGLELRSCQIRPLELNFRDVLERTVVRAYNTAMTEAVAERTEAYQNLAKARREKAN